MDGLARAAGGEVVIKIDDEKSPAFGTWLLPPMRARDFATVEQHLLASEKDPFDAVLPQMEKLEQAGMKRLADRLFKMAYRDKLKSKRTIPQQEVSDFIDSYEGLLFTMGLCLRKRYPAITDAQVAAILEAKGEQEMKKLRDRASGLDFAGNSTGPEQPADSGPHSNGAGVVPSSETTSENPFRGDASTDPLPSNTDGAPPSSTN